MSNAKKSISRRFMAVLLSFVLVLGLIPTSALTAYAATPEHPNGVTVSVTDQDGKGIAGATVEYHINSTVNGADYASGTATTDENGCAEVLAADKFIADDLTLSATAVLADYTYADGSGRIENAAITSDAQDFAIQLRSTKIPGVTVTANSGLVYQEGTAQSLVTVAGTKGTDSLRDLGPIIRRQPAVFAVYLVLRLIVIGTLVSSIIRQEYESAFICLLVLVLFMLPFFIQQNFGIELPSTLEIIILLFIFAAEILGELGCYFITYPHWDSMLHTTTGFLCAATGFALIDILNRNSRIKFQLSPVYVALAAFCFSMTVGVLWEFFEFGMDRVFHMDMQKDTIVHSVTSVMLDPTNSNIPVTIDDITSVAVNGRDLGFDGYLDIGLYDTMADLFVNFIGAVVFSTIGYFYIKHRGRGKIARAFIPTIAGEASPSPEPPEAPEAPRE